MRAFPRQGLCLPRQLTGSWGKAYLPIIRAARGPAPGSDVASLVAGNKWYKQHLSYRLVNWPQHLPEPAVRGAVRAAFQLWSNVSALEFWEAPATGPADIRLTFFQGDHNDGLSNAFDGPGAGSLSPTWQEGDPARRGRLWRAMEHSLSLWPCPSCIALQRALRLLICHMGTGPARFCAMWLLGWSDEVLQGKCKL